jgi:hypothetical protein
MRLGKSIKEHGVKQTTRRRIVEEADISVYSIK